MSHGVQVQEALLGEASSSAGVQAQLSELGGPGSLVVHLWRRLPQQTSFSFRHTNPIVENGQSHPCQKVIQEVR